MSSSITHMLVWRFLRTGYSLIGAILGIACLFPAFMVGLIWLADPFVVQHMREDPTVYTVIFALAIWLVFPVLINFACGYVRALYALPLSTRRIVNTQLVCGVVSLACTHLVTVLFYRVVFDAVLPFFGPLLVMGPMVVITAGCAALLFDFRWWRPFLVMCLFGVASWYMGHRVTLSEVKASTDWLMPTLGEFACLIAFASIGYWQALRGVTLDRSGELRYWPDFEAMWHRIGVKLSDLSRRTFSDSLNGSPTGSQVKFEFWQKGLIVPGLAVVFGGISLISAYHNPHDWLHNFINGAISILPAATLVTGLIMGMLNLGGKDMTISQYRATRPLTDTQLASSVMKACLLSVAATIGVVVIYAIVVYVWSLVQPVTGVRGTYSSRISAADYLFVVVAGWVLMGLAASGIMCGRSWLSMLPVFLMFAGFLSQPFLRMLIPDPQVRDQLMKIALGSVSLLVIVGTVIAFSVAVRRRLVTRLTALVVGLLTIFGITGVITNVGAAQMHIEQWAALLGGVCLAAAPFATAPLAIALNRHR
ncbi:MAG: hypothetical protein KDA93_06400 [Planctomycetaceae bacterium]|nr:hypothetical protein [Planctomycetaceae bacterium]